MTQQEIYQNMSKPLMVPKFNNIVDNHAVQHAVENTYGKGINPESVPIVFEEVQNLINTIQAMSDSKGEPLPEWANVIKQALTSAEL